MSEFFNARDVGGWLFALLLGAMSGLGSPVHAAESRNEPEIEQLTAPAAPQDAARAFEGAKRVRIAPYRFEIRSGERLSRAIQSFVSRERWSLAWEASGDFVVMHGFALEAPRMESVLERVLSAYGLTATLYEANRVVAVRQNAVLP